MDYKCIIERVRDLKADAIMLDNKIGCGKYKFELGTNICNELAKDAIIFDIVTYGKGDITSIECMGIPVELSTDKNAIKLWREV